MHLPRAILALTLCVAAFAAKTTMKPKTPALTAEQRAAQLMMKPLSLRDRVAQLIIGACYGDAPSSRSAEFKKYDHWVHDLHIGGLIVVNRVQNGMVRYAEPHAMAVFLNRMQKMAKVPLIVAGDFERGSSMRVAGGTPFPYSMAFAAARDPEATHFEGLVTAREARALGVHWILAPVADVNNNPENPVINIRSYGENPNEVAEHVTAYIEGAHSDPKTRVLVSAKHFPGHGDTNINSHLGMARLEASKERMEAVELKPFRAAIAHGADSVMTAHMSVPAIEPEEIPATVSPKVLTGLLRGELEFKGIIVTDALDMAGVTAKFHGGEASVRALEAGADVLLMPPNPEQAIRAVVAAIESGRLTRRRVEESVLRVLAAKIHVGLTPGKKLVDLEAISDVLDPPEADERAQQVADRAVTLVRNEGNVVPLANPDSSCLVVLVERRQSQYGQRIIDEVRKRAPQMRVAVLDASLPGAALADAAGDTARCHAIAVTTFVTASDTRNTVALGGDLGPFLEKLTAGPAPVVLVSLGSPYLLASFPKAAAYLATFSVASTSEIAAVKALFGEIPITGHLPVTIPGFARYGDGIQTPAKTH
jgi:beta-N-acetylhexosaminidase